MAVDAEIDLLLHDESKIEDKGSGWSNRRRTSISASEHEPKRQNLTWLTHLRSK